MERVSSQDALKRAVLDEGLCAACGACVGGCPYMTTFRGKTVVLDRCTVEHGRCYRYCPMTEFDPDAVSALVFERPHDTEALGHLDRVISSQAADPAVAALGQGGGTVTALMLLALEEGIIDSAVLTRILPGEEYARGVVATTTEEIQAAAGSKFVGSHSLAAVRQALDAGHRRIGVVGLPCQVRSLRKMALYDLKQENLKERIALVVGLFCNWAFSSRDFAAFLAPRFGPTSIKRFQIPPPPANVLEVETDDGATRVPLDELRPLIQESCRTCPDMTGEFADVSVGMYEGMPGWNTLIVRTSLGTRLIEDAVRTGRLRTDAFPDSNLEHLKKAALQKRKRASQA
ncbi:MAG: Coenzyme F420 hydrogenase/dehydrogenase, beta subunit C-terminal domain [Desulfomonile tiedjei]|nr:Coenzyme F420 hydrogenase/dehydrogenase, beta subunit C-terminal domain [Desulfomonile tiedjei]